MDKRLHLSLLENLFVFILFVSIPICGLTDQTAESSNLDAVNYLKPPRPVKLNKISFTQKGYIQFLKYLTPVPAISDFTFCIWLRSANLTYSHPLLSYSKHDDQRLIRAWVTPKGEAIKLALKEIEIFNVPVNFKENIWYHICQSWSKRTGHWDLYINGKLKAHGQNDKVQGMNLPKGGDIVVGQEYTDFDKGLDDGIEGDIFGFNMVLSSTSPPQKQIYKDAKGAFANRRVSVAVPGTIKGQYIVSSAPIVIRRVPNRKVKRNKRQVYNSNPLLQYDSRLLPRYPYYPIHGYQPIYNYNQPNHPQHSIVRNKNSRIANDVIAHATKSLGSRLIEMSYNCELGKGAPLKGKDVLISWTRTPVRVFGGALIKIVDPFCYEPLLNKIVV